MKKITNLSITYAVRAAKDPNSTDTVIILDTRKKFKINISDQVWKLVSSCISDYVSDEVVFEVSENILPYHIKY